jgi:fructose-specific phosphotransferase system IIA component
MSLIHRSLIKINLHLENKENVIHEMVKMLDENQRVNDKEKLILDIYARENEASTSMGKGIAIPHAQTDEIKEPCLVFIKTKNKISWNGDPVQLFFGIFVPKDQSESIHLKILASLARKLIDDDFTTSLDTSSSEEEIYNLLNQIETDIRD